MSRPRHIRQAARAKREPFEVAANDDDEQTWAERYAEHAQDDTAESYQLDQIASANSGTDAINRRD
jgi:hypothetical protein